MTTEYLNINTIDNCVDTIIDNFYDVLTEYKLKNSLFDFIKNNYEKLKNETINLVNNISNSLKIKDIITTDNEYKNVQDIFLNYTFLYLFFSLSITTKLSDIINLLNNLATKYSDSIFKNKYLAQFDKYYKYILDYHFVIKNIKLDNIELFKQNNPNYIETINIIELLDTTLLNDIIEDKENITHNIIKVIIFREIYIKEDKQIIYKLVENEEFNNAEFKYIEIIDSKYDFIDYATIESLFSIEDIKLGLAEEIYQMINDTELTKFITDIPLDNKIHQLFNNKILIPITDEFLRYHKESDMFDKNTTTTIENKDRSNKKDNTKIKYIITRLNKVKNYYSQKVQANNELKTEIDKIFYHPMLYRKVIIINDIEEINILRKLELQGKSVVDANEYYDDLYRARLYPFIDFSISKIDSFEYKPIKSVQSLRYCNFEFKHDPNFPNMLDTELQYRIFNNRVNIVGIALPLMNPNLKKTNLECLDVVNTYNMAKINKDVFTVCLKKLNSLFLNDKKYSKMLYWIFDNLKVDNNIDQVSKNDYIRYLFGLIYDEMVNITYQTILNEINKYSEIDIFTIKKIIKELETTLVLIPRQSNKYTELQKFIYFIKIESNLDINDNLENQLDINYIKLPTISKKKLKMHIIKISSRELLDNKLNDIDMYEGHICQHTITWDNIIRLKKSNPNKFNQELFNFIKKYISENKESDYVCKSCYQLIDIKKYITDIFPGSNSIAISNSIEKELETIREYEKFSKSIKNMDKIIEKIAYSSNINILVGSTQEIKFSRQEIIKTVIDLIEIQYKILYSNNTTVRKDRLTNSIKNYGCNMSNFFLFKLDNDIFTYSSKEIDKFKLFKMNNILTYIIVCIINDLNPSQILNLTFDKLVNYFLFTKFGINLFDNLYIRISNKNDIAPIKNYILLCYVIYYISGIYSKLNLWYNEDIPYKQNNINAQLQRVIIHTLVDCVNSILEINSKGNTNYIYNLISIKFFNKLNYMYDNKVSNNILQNLNTQNDKKVIITSNKKLKYNISTVNATPFKPYNSDGKFITESIYGINSISANIPTIYYISDKYKEFNIPEDTKKEINDKLMNDVLINTGKIYDIDGNKRTKLLSDEESKKLKIDTLKDIIKNIRKNSLININKKIFKQKSKIEKINIKLLKNAKYIEELQKKSNTDINDIIVKFVDKLETIIGKDTNINNNNFYLNQDVYEINHDYRGNKKTSIFILESDNLIKFKKNDSYFKQDIYYYEDKTNKVIIYYSGIEKYMLAYKENSKDYTIVKNSNCYIKINYSLFNQLILFGFSYINYKIIKNQDMNNVINNLLFSRLQNLKNSISVIQQIIYQIKNKFDELNVSKIAKYYQTKIKNIETFNTTGERIFQDWNIISSTLYYTPISINSNINIITLPNSNVYLSTYTLLKFISNNDTILFYIISQLNMLLDINTDNFNKTNIAYLIINIILQLFNNYIKFENANYDISVKQFYSYISTIIESSSSENETIDYSNLSEEEIQQIKEQLDVNREENEAIDADQDETNEDFGDEDIIIHDRVSGEY